MKKKLALQNLAVRFSMSTALSRRKKNKMKLTKKQKLAKSINSTGYNMSWTLYVYDEDCEAYFPDDEGLVDQKNGFPEDRAEAVSIVKEILGHKYPGVRWQLRKE